MIAKLKPTPKEYGGGLWQNCGLDEQPHSTLLVMHIKTFPELIARIRQWILEGK